MVRKPCGVWWWWWWWWRRWCGEWAQADEKEDGDGWPRAGAGPGGRRALGREFESWKRGMALQPTYLVVLGQTLRTVPPARPLPPHTAGPGPADLTAWSAAAAPPAAVLRWQHLVPTQRLTTGPAAALGSPPADSSRRHTTDITSVSYIGSPNTLPETAACYQSEPAALDAAMTMCTHQHAEACKPLHATPSHANRSHFICGRVTTGCEVGIKQSAGCPCNTPR